ncbi:hypothetical protein GCM10010174_73530 [Kutzneria viridogrisea]|uniref:4-hydroxy-3-methylbut-2-enyl diphosphate reductase n=2 Tax=Kutzneria TaxID=43356 RepID=W5W8Y0_9PSEU|nr:hypothetical protein [Kutzneria albida]AHH97407.1 hypothetical protein KALB_4043 [Kutzneria albida DSM 43870]MBA8930675.1 4-hydroxy-3-methylbut-2-enyl diphosphate reductase [Kutzneria viridogrisea]
MPSSPEPPLLIAVALSIESCAIARTLRARLVHVGMRARHADRLDAALLAEPDSAVAVAGVAGALSDRLRPGQVVVADEVRSTEGVRRCPSAPLLASALRDTGLTVHVGPVLEASRAMLTSRRTAVDGALAVDLESATLLARTEGHPTAVVRVISDTPRHQLVHPGTLATGFTALRTLSRVGDPLRRWAAATGDRTLLLASPRSRRTKARPCTRRGKRGGALAHGQDRPVLVSSAEEAARLVVPKASGISARTQMTLALAQRADVVLVAGTADSTYTRCLVELARRTGTPVHLVTEVSDIDLDWLTGAWTVGVSAGAAARAELVVEIVDALCGLGPVAVREITTAPADDHRFVCEEVNPT